MKETYKYSYKVGENSLNSLSVYNVGHQKCEPGYQWGPGIRDHYCIHYIIAGKGYYVVNHRIYELKAGEMFILYPNTEVRYYADVESPWEYAWVGFAGTDASSILRSTAFSKEVPWIKQGVPGERIRKGLQEIYSKKGSTFRDSVAMAGALYTLLSVFMQHAPSERTKDIRSVYVEKAVNYIASNYSYPIAIEEVASYVGVSRSHLFRSFQSYMQMSPKEYLDGFRIKQACQLLKETGLPIAVVAYSVGFENNLYFSKAFKNQKGMTPTAYRRKSLPLKD